MYASSHNQWVTNFIVASYVAEVVIKWRYKKLCQSQKHKLGEDRTKTERLSKKELKQSKSRDFVPVETHM